MVRPKGCPSVSTSPSEGQSGKIINQHMRPYFMANNGMIGSKGYPFTIFDSGGENDSPLNSPSSLDLSHICRILLAKIATSSEVTISKRYTIELFERQSNLS